MPEEECGPPDRPFLLSAGVSQSKGFAPFLSDTSEPIESVSNLTSFTSSIAAAVRDRAAHQIYDKYVHRKVAGRGAFSRESSAELTTDLFGSDVEEPTCGSSIEDVDTTLSLSATGSTMTLTPESNLENMELSSFKEDSGIYRSSDEPRVLFRSPEVSDDGSFHAGRNGGNTLHLRNLWKISDSEESSSPRALSVGMLCGFSSDSQASEEMDVPARKNRLASFHASNHFLATEVGDRVRDHFRQLSSKVMGSS